MNARRIIGILLTVIGPPLLLSCPWLVLSFEPIRSWVFDEGWALLKSGQCIWLSELNTSALVGWYSTISLIAVASLFAGIWLFRSAKFQKIHIQL
jgi:hypothetical protein